MKWKNIKMGMRYYIKDMYGSISIIINTIKIEDKRIVITGQSLENEPKPTLISIPMKILISIEQI